MTRLGQRPALNGLRGVAVLMVVAGHAAVPGLDGAGGPGVTIFFVLSGFLITKLLLEELGDTGSVSLPRFYARRALRLFPALALLLVVITAYEAVTGGVDVPAVLSVALYSGNWYRVVNGDPYALGVLLTHTWSLAVEEQFYLVWPVLLIALTVAIRDRRQLLVVLLVTAVAIACWRGLLWVQGAGENRVYVGTDARADALVLGAALAVALELGLARRPPAWLLAVAAVGVWAVSAIPDNLVAASPAVSGFTLTLGVVIVELAAAAFILRALAAPWRLLTLAPLLWFGQVSYALYLWHAPILNVAGNDQRGAALLVSVLAAAVSWYLVERPALRVKGRLVHRRVRPAVEIGVGAAVLD